MASIPLSRRCESVRIGSNISASSRGSGGLYGVGLRAKHTGELGVCVGTAGPGAVHLLNGLYDAHMDGAPVVAITGMTFHDLIGTRYQQGKDKTKLMQNVALYNVEVTGPEHAVLVTNRALAASPSVIAGSPISLRRRTLR